MIEDWREAGEAEAEMRPRDEPKNLTQAIGNGARTAIKLQAMADALRRPRLPDRWGRRLQAGVERDEARRRRIVLALSDADRDAESRYVGRRHPGQLIDARRRRGAKIIDELGIFLTSRPLRRGGAAGSSDGR